jgi:hypothetical protein
MKRTFTILVAVVFFALGATCMYLVKRPSPSVPQDWITVIPDAFPVLFDMSAMNIDIPAPSPGKIEGQVKYLSRENGLRIGYRLKLPIKANPVAALPEKYRQSTKYGFAIPAWPTLTITFGPPG